MFADIRDTTTENGVMHGKKSPTIKLVLFLILPTHADGDADDDSMIDDLFQLFQDENEVADINNDAKYVLLFPNAFVFS